MEGWGMPYLNLQTTQSLDPEIGERFLKSASGIVVEHLGKPESVMMTALHEPVAMTLGGKESPAAILELSVLDLDPYEVEGLYAALHALALAELGLPGDRIFITFTSVPRGQWGWNGNLF